MIHCTGLTAMRLGITMITVPIRVKTTLRMGLSFLNGEERNIADELQCGVAEHIL